MKDTERPNHDNPFLNRLHNVLELLSQRIITNSEKNKKISKTHQARRDKLEKLLNGEETKLDKETLFQLVERLHASKIDADLITLVIKMDRLSEISKDAFIKSSVVFSLAIILTATFLYKPDNEFRMHTEISLILWASFVYSRKAFIAKELRDELKQKLRDSTDHITVFYEYAEKMIPDAIVLMQLLHEDEKRRSNLAGEKASEFDNDLEIQKNFEVERKQKRN